MANAAQDVTEYYRYCPGEERIKISDAMCVGRRRANFHKCKGCQFNDDTIPPQVASGTSTAPESSLLAAEKEKRERIEAIFKAYDVRGLFPDQLDTELAWRIGLATAQFLRAELRGYDRTRPEMSAVAVGHDMRRSSPELVRALIEGLRAGGSPVHQIGMIDSPQLYFAVNHLSCCGGVQVTASHNPERYNGFKICGQGGKPIGDDTGLNKIRKIAQNTIQHPPAQLEKVDQIDLAEPYKEFVRRFLRTEGIGFDADQPLRLVVDASNGMAGRWLPHLFDDIEWLEIIRLNFEHNGQFIHDPNPLVESNLTQVKDRVIRSKAHLGACFDGDADRCVFIDGTGQVVPADLTTALLSRHFLQASPGASVVYDLRSSRVVPEEIRKAGGIPRRERCGHAYIRKALKDSKGVFGGELSGHYYFRDNWYCDSGMIALAEVLNLITMTGETLQKLVAPLRRYATSGERNFENDHVEATLRRLAEIHVDGEVDFLDGITVTYDDWWFNVRASNTEPYLRLNVEADNQKLLERRLSELEPHLGTPVEH
jgi:phosphomannomutase